MIITSNLKTAMKDAGLDPPELAERVGISTKRLREFLNDRYLTISREQLRRLMIFTDAEGYPLYQVREHPLWSSFTESAYVVRGLRADGQRPANDDNAAGKLKARLDEAGCQHPERTAGQNLRIGEVEGLMKTSNCLFIGSPAVNEGTGEALRLLTGSKNTSASETNRRRLGFTFLRPDVGKSMFFDDSTGDRGILVHSGKRPHLLRLDHWDSDEDFKKARKNRARDAAVLIACYKPLLTRRKVATIILCGYHGLATKELGRALRDGQPHIAPGDLEPGSLTKRIFVVEYSKMAGKRKRARRTTFLEPPWTRKKIKSPFGRAK